MTEDERQEKLEYAHKRDSLTSPTIDDVDFDDEGKYFWDCWNSEYCSKYRKREFNRHSCLCGRERGGRCSIEEKEQIRNEALKNRFIFSDK